MLLNSILALMLLHNSDVSDSERDTILSAAASSTSISVDTKTNDNFIQIVA